MEVMSNHLVRQYEEKESPWSVVERMIAEPLLYFGRVCITHGI